MRFAPRVIALAVFAVMLFIPGLTGGFILDDSVTILRNYVLYVDTLNIDEFIYAALSFHQGHGERALPMLSFAIDYWRAGSMDAITFRTTNLFIHALTTVVLALFFRRLLLLAKWSPQQAACGALAFTLLWAIHPLQVSSVLYIVQRMQTMATLFMVLALWFYLLMRQHQIAGGRGRVQGIFVVLFWLLGLTCKEDAVLLPVYTLVLELTLLHFKAGQTVVAKGLKQSYTLFIVLAGLAYFFVVLPRLGCWGGVCWQRDFNSWERLLTQGRVLVMYIGQILLPLSDRLPFIYDNYPPSRSLWQPWTTLPALLVVTGLIAWAWRWRHTRPLFSLGVLLFFAGHFVSSNVVLLELVFEHRNHFPLIGAVLALSDLFLLIGQRLQLGQRAITTLFIVVVFLLAANTLYQSYIWGDSARLGQKMTKLVPTSTRAWNQYAAVYFTRYDSTKNPEDLAQAVRIMNDAYEHIPSPLFISNIIAYKAILGSVQEQDWQRYYQSLTNSGNKLEKKQSVDFLIDDFLRGFDINENKLIITIELLKKQSITDNSEYLRVGNMVYNSKRRDKAIVFFKKFVEVSPKGDPVAHDLVVALAESGHLDWARTLEEAQKQSVK